MQITKKAIRYVRTDRNYRKASLLKIVFLCTGDGQTDRQTSHGVDIQQLGVSSLTNKQGWQRP